MGGTGFALVTVGACVGEAVGLGVGGGVGAGVAPTEGAGVGFDVGAVVGSGVAATAPPVVTVTESRTSSAEAPRINSPSGVTGLAWTTASDICSPESGARPVNRMTRGSSPGHWGSTMVSSNVLSTSGSVTTNSPQHVLGSPPLAKIV